MSKTFFPFDEGPGATVNEEQWRAIATLWRDTGVIYESSNSLLVYGNSSGMQVKVKAGGAYIEGFYFYSTEEDTLAITAPGESETNPRYDRVVVQVDWTENTIAFVVLEGEPAVSPEIPALTQTASIYEISLGTVYVAHDADTITAGNVVTDRTWSVSAGGGVDVLTMQVFS